LHPKSENSSDMKSKSEMDYSQKASWSNRKSIKKSR
jgi:hypothetical protein